MTSRSLPKLVWKNNSHLEINGLTFNLSCDTKELQTGGSTVNTFLLGKPKEMVENSFLLSQDRKIRKIFEMGILHGGSVVLYDQIFQPEKLVAIEYMRNRVSALDGYIVDHARAAIVRPYYGVDQADRSKMAQILNSEFPDRDIDLIVDDASHLYDETRRAFNICFPYLRSGGLYVIEDWAWAHWPGDYWQKDNEYFKDRVALSNILTELFMLTASCPGFIQNIVVEPSVITVTRGSGALPVGEFDMEDHYLLRGKVFNASL